MFFKVSWDEDFDTLMMHLWSKYGKELFTLDGIGEQMDLHKFSKKFFNNPNSTADVSVDANANVVAKTGIEYNFEMSKPLKRYNSYFLLWKELKRNYGLMVANQVIESQLIGDIYINDFTSVAEPYCFNYSTKDIESCGLAGISQRLHIEPPKSLATFFRQVEQFLVVAANSTLGATGLADLLIVASRYVDKIRETGKDGHVMISDVETYVSEQLTSLIYSLNWQYRSNQSAFTNVSLYDNTFLDSLCPDYGANKETVKMLQRIYCEVMNSEMRRTPLTFPVTTACFCTDENKEIQDKDFLKFIAEQNREFGFINIYNGSTSTLSSCCFSSDTMVSYAVLADDGTPVFYRTTFKEGFDDFEDKPILVYHKGEYVHARFVRVEKNEHLKMYEVSFEDGSRVVMTADHQSPVLNGSDRSAEKLTMSDKMMFYTQDGIEYRNPLSIREVPYSEEYAYCVERVDYTDPYFTLPFGLVTHNCRLRSNRNNEYFNSFGAGSTKIGSLGVVTVNLPRAAHLAKGDFTDFINRVKGLFTMAQRINSCKRKLVKKRIELGAAPLYINGYMDLSKQYSTFGIVGVNEAVQLLGGDILKPDGQKMVNDLLDNINKWIDTAEKKENAPHNTEQVPAESSAVKLAQKDKYLGMDFGVPLYSNQFIPLTTKADMYDRLRLQGMFDSKMSGGAIAHINVGEPIEDTDTMVHLMEYAARQGVVYWAINYKLYCCPEKHTWVGTEMCPTCGKHWESEITRVVGFFTTVKNWNPVRRTEDWPNRQFYGKGELK